MNEVNRRWTVRLYPSKKQAEALDWTLRHHCELYNAALENVTTAWKRSRTHVTHYEQANLIKEIKAVRPEFTEITQMTLNETLGRLHKAFAAFFRRVKLGQTPGYPRFKSHRRYSGWTYPRHGNGCKVYPIVSVINGRDRWKNGSLYLQNIGKMRMRGKSRTAGDIKTVTIVRRQGRWYASVVVACIPERQSGIKSVGLDWGVTDYVTLAYADGTTQAIANDRLFQAQQEKAAERQRSASKSLRGRRSKRAAKKHLQIARAHAKLASQRKDRAHKLSAKLVAEHALIATEELKITNMTRSAKGTVEKPGNLVAQKSGLNREILDTAPGMLMNMLRYKAEEAGCVLEFVNTRKVKPSQTCPGCGKQAKKTLAERVHACGCGMTMSRDGAAALVMLLSSETYSGQKLALGSPPKTPPRIASAI